MEILNAYHGTNEMFSKFNCPAYFTDDYRTAIFFANGGRCYEIDEAETSLNQGAVLTCTLMLQDPLVINLNGQSWGGFHIYDNEQLERNCIDFISNGDENEIEYFTEYGLTTNFLAEYAELLGYDGVVFYNCLEENNRVSTQYVLFHPDSIIIENNQEATYEL